MAAQGNFLVCFFLSLNLYAEQSLHCLYHVWSNVWRLYKWAFILCSAHEQINADFALHILGKSSVDFALQMKRALVLGINKTNKKSRIRETSNHSTDADRRTNTNLESLRDLSRKKEKMGRLTRPRVHAYTRPRVHTTDPRGGDGRSAATPRF